MANKDTTSKTITVALVLCIVCSLVVSSAAVLLKDRQDANKRLDRYSNILAAAGLLDADQNIEEQYNKLVTARVVDLDTGDYTDAVDAESYNQLKAAKDAKLSTDLNAEQDQAKISRRENYSVVYLIEQDGELQKIVLPIRGYGLWSTLYGFIALEGDANTIAGLGFYEHGETPGLGGEVDNPKWKGLWPGKQVYRDGDVQIEMVKGSVNPSSANAGYQVDGLAGASLTSRGVSNLIQFWMGEQGFQKFLTKLRSGEAG